MTTPTLPLLHHLTVVLPVNLPRLFADPLALCTFSASKFHLFQSLQPVAMRDYARSVQKECRLTVKQPRPHGYFGYGIFFAVGGTAMSHADIAFARSHAGNEPNHPRNGPNHDKPPALAPPLHQHHRQLPIKGHPNISNSTSCAPSIVFAAVCRHRATPLLVCAIDQTIPLTPKPSTATCNALVPP
ncbi:hypothetical protein IWZ01DRAFT_341181 [Phyllosticta capitalensis]